MSDLFNEFQIAVGWEGGWYRGCMVVEFTTTCAISAYHH
jgi:hypothetical protein